MDIHLPLHKMTLSQKTLLDISFIKQFQNMYILLTFFSVYIIKGTDHLQMNLAL